MNVIEFKKKAKTGIIKAGTVTVNDDGTILIERFEFGGVDMETAIELARSWAIKKLQQA